RVGPLLRRGEVALGGAPVRPPAFDRAPRRDLARRDRVLLCALRDGAGAGERFPERMAELVSDADVLRRGARTFDPARLPPRDDGFTAREEELRAAPLGPGHGASRGPARTWPRRRVRRGGPGVRGVCGSDAPA